MNKTFYYISLLLVFNIVYGQNNVQPAPKFIETGEEKVVVSSDNNVTVLTSNVDEEKAALYLEHIIRSETGNDDYSVTQFKIGNDSWKISLKQMEYAEDHPNPQFYSILFKEKTGTIEISSPSGLGLLYGIVTLSEFMFEEENKLLVKKVEVKDHPSYQRRMFVANPASSDIPSLFDFALKNKFETVVIASRQHPWYEVTDDYLAILDEIKKWKDKFGGPKVMQSHNIYEGRDIVISDTNDVNALKEVIETSYNHGIEKLMILSDDTPPFKFGEGYILTDPNDKKMFDHFEAANTYLVNQLVDWFEQMEFNIETYYAPAFYTYEEMHYGDMELFIDTPWEEDAFKPFFRDLMYLGENINEDVYLIWCGPYVRSRKITEADLRGWTENLAGRVPFLWDNTIYSHHPFTSTSLLTAWDNDFPHNFYELTAGSGMFVNGDCNAESGKAASVTTNDYLWNPDNYNPELSLNTAVERIYGNNVTDLVLQFKEAELNLRKTIGERQLWFETDTLWQQIREIRFITDKNPFYYHLNYTRLKALRLQLKASVNEPGPKETFIDRCRALVEKRGEILDSIEAINPGVYHRLYKLAEPLPDFTKIQ